MEFDNDLDALSLAVSMLLSCTDDEFDDDGWSQVLRLESYLDKRKEEKKMQEGPQKTEYQKDQLPCDPEMYNDRRADMASSAIRAFQQEAYGLTDDDRYQYEMVLSDLLCNLHHWADRHGVDFTLRATIGEQNYADETRCEETRA